MDLIKTTLLFLCSSLLLACQLEKTTERILVIVPHPDDETTTGTVLANYDKTDSVSLLIAKDGQFGDTDHAGIPAGDSLLSFRESEAKYPCINLDIYALIMLGKQDGLGLKCKGQVYEQVSNLKIKLREEFQSIKPTKIITLGSQRDTGYSDHRMAGNLTTEFLLQTRMIHDIDLYFFSWSQATS